MRSIPDGVNHSANMADPEDWIDPLNGYAYDCFNPDVLMNMKVESGKVVLPSGARYSALVIPVSHPMKPEGSYESVIVHEKINDLQRAGANIILLPYTDSSFAKLGIEKDVEIRNNDHTIAWTHRRMEDGDIYFIANQRGSSRMVQLTFRVQDKIPEVLDPVNGSITFQNWRAEKKGTYVELWMEGNQSLFIIFRKKARLISHSGAIWITDTKSFTGSWKVQFNKSYGGPEKPVIFNELKSWTQHNDESIKYYSGTAVYRNMFTLNKQEKNRTLSIVLDSLCDIATVTVNGIDCGTLWTKPFLLDISKAAKEGQNTIEIAVTNTWHNRLIGDNLLPTEKRITWTTAPFRLANKPLFPAGLPGNIKLQLQ
jgi:hypothetical protein